MTYQKSRNLSDKEQQAVVRMFHDGLGMARMALILKCSHGIVLRVLKANGLHRTPKQATVANKIPMCLSGGHKQFVDDMRKVYLA